ncbi:MAG: SDR family oxidoreductase [Gemmatimonadaceae bacterium]|nr:SDR family oxidoreductase [Gemmatimonadaceae bacterium]
MSADARQMSGRVCVVTGATAGIGRETALGLARMGATVVIVARDAAKAARTVDEIVRATGSARVEIVIADFASLDAVRAAAAEIGRRYGAVHVLVNNAGVVKKQRTLSADGFELTFAVNHLAPFLFTREIMPFLRAGAPARIVNVASAAEAHGPIDFGDLQSEKRYRGFLVYGKTKLMNILFSYELAARLAGTGITANCLHPGAVATDMLRQLPWWLYALISPFLLTPEKGAATQLFLATSPAVEGVSGAYYVKGKAARSSPRSYDVEMQKRLWEVSETLVSSRASRGAMADTHLV